jgi:hypothetical protein
MLRAELLMPAVRTLPMNLSRARRARKTHSACGGHCKPIQPGDIYLEHVEFPGGDSGYADTAGHPVRMAECRSCAERYGRGALISAYENDTPIQPE